MSAPEQLSTDNRPKAKRPIIRDRQHRVATALFVVLAGATLLYALVINPSGSFSVDEAIYHRMTQSFSGTGSLAIMNGYEEYPSPELIWSNTRVYNGRLVPQYPYLYPVLAAPFYRLAGFRGLYLFNALAFLATTLLCYALARLLFKDKPLPLLACAVLVLGTFAWEYSQAAWPHAVSMLFTTGAVYLALRSFITPEPGQATLCAGAAGLAIGLGTGIRLDAIFMLPAMLLPFFFVRPWRPRQILAIGFGTLPGLALLAITNFFKFGTLSPFSYGTRQGSIGGITPYLPLVLLVLAVGVALWASSRFSPRRRVFFLSIVTLTLVGLPATRHILIRLAGGFYQLVVDLRIRPHDLQEPALSRGPGGSVIYLNLGLKKALLQSCPYLVCLLLPFADMLRNRKHDLILYSLYAASLLHVAIFSFFAWHGGMSFNMRYFLPALPFTSILTAYTWREILSDQALRSRHFLTAVGLAVAAIMLLTVIAGHLSHETFYLSLPLLMALLLLMSLAIPSIIYGSASPLRIGIFGAILAACVMWSGITAFGYDLSRTFTIRSAYARTGQAVSDMVCSDALVFTDFPDALFGLSASKQVRIAIPARDNFADFLPLTAYHLNAGRPVYISFSHTTLRAVASRNLFDSLTVTPLLEHAFGTLALISQRGSHP